MNYNKITISLLLASALLLASCEDLLTPSPDNRDDEARVLREASYAEGILLNAYKNISNSYSFEETATDDAVTNVITSGYRRIATGEWSSQYNPLSVWNSSYQSIFYMNYFLSIVDKVIWSPLSPERNELFRQRFTGEAHAFRAWYNFELLRNHGGEAKDNSMRGFILLDKYVEPSQLDPNLPRASYDDCVNFIIEDCDKALLYLPLEYSEGSDLSYNQVFGPQNKNRFNGRGVRALKSRVLLHAASPAFNKNNDLNKWIKAAEASAVLLSEIGGVSGFSSTGRRWYLNQNDPEIIWRRGIGTILTWEQQNFPPSLFGNGQTNPSQNLVDAFPMANGYPIFMSLESGYNANTPYTGRDPRLRDYIVFNGNTIGTNVINTHTGHAQDGLNRTPQSTKTGYYLKKLMNENVRLTPGNQLGQVHFYTIFRYTEMYLNYAEAANEAWGPDADPKGYGFTPRQIIAAIRNRAGISQPDVYLQSITTPAEMRELIRNERRIELCFEGFRFWDLRRWDLNLTETAKGMQITGTEHLVINVENRTYQPFMKYGPVPYTETLSNKALLQNIGW